MLDTTQEVIDMLKRKLELTQLDRVQAIQEAFNKWADYRMADYQSISPFNEAARARITAKIETLQFAKLNLARIIKES